MKFDIASLISLIPITIAIYVLYDLLKQRIIQKKNRSFQMLLLSSRILGYDVVIVQDPKRKTEETFTLPPNLTIIGAPSNRDVLLRDIQKFVDDLGVELILGISGEKITPKRKKTNRTVHFLCVGGPPDVPDLSNWIQ